MTDLEKEMLEMLQKSNKRMDRLMEAIRTGRKIDPREMKEILKEGREFDTHIKRARKAIKQGGGYV